MLPAQKLDNIRVRNLGEEGEGEEIEDRRGRVSKGERVGEGGLASIIIIESQLCRQSYWEMMSWSSWNCKNPWTQSASRASSLLEIHF